MENTASLYMALDIEAWDAKCDQLAKQAYKGCGCSYDLFASRFSHAVDAAIKELPMLPEEQIELALTIAKQHGYEDEIEPSQGCCSHGIDLGCCPAGCE